VNGGIAYFDTTSLKPVDFLNWIEAASDGAIEDEQTLVNSGSHALKLTWGTAGTQVYQQFAVTAGEI
jgi:hypothetical protein